MVWLSMAALFTLVLVGIPVSHAQVTRASQGTFYSLLPSWAFHSFHFCTLCPVCSIPTLSSRVLLLFCRHPWSDWACFAFATALHCLT
jgi:hypothetical protein